MKKLFFAIILLTTSCTTNINKSDFNFSKEMNMDEFKVKLKEYAENNPYPNMDD